MVTSDMLPFCSTHFASDYPPESIIILKVCEVYSTSRMRKQETSLLTELMWSANVFITQASYIREQYWSVKSSLLHTYCRFVLSISVTVLTFPNAPCPIAYPR